MHCAGLFFLKGANLELGFQQLLLQVVRRRSQCYLEESRPSLPILRSRDRTILARNETLTYYFLFKGMRRPIHLNLYNDHDLALLVGSRHSYGYVTMDHHLRQLARLQVAADLGRVMAGRYFAVWYQDPSLPDTDVFYVDAHEKVIWSEQPVPKGFVSARREVHACLKQLFLHGRGGHPLYCLTYPGDLHLTKGLPDLLDAFEAAIGKEVVHVIVVDREGLSLDLILALRDRHKAIVTLLRSDQYTSEADFQRKGDFCPLVDERLGEVTHQVAEAEFLLDKRELLRCALMRDLARDKLVPIVTTVSVERQPDIVQVARWYLARWDTQENSLRSLVEFVDLNINFGLKAKREVPNRVVARKSEALLAHLQALDNKINGKLEKRQQEEDFLERQVARHDKKLIALLQEMARLEQKPNPARQEKLEAQIREYRQRHHDRIAKHLARKAEAETLIERYRTERTRTIEQLANLNPQAKLYEVLTEKDQIMTHLRLGVHNSVLFARQYYFGPRYQRATPLTLWRTFFSQDGYYRETEEVILVTLKPYRDAQLQRDAVEACQRFNARQIRTYTGKLLQLTVAECK